MLAGIAQHESGLHPLAIHDNTARKTTFPGDKAAAISTASALIKRGHSVDLGLFQINSGNFGWLGLTVEAAFDPCQSAAAGAKVLTAFSRYNTGSPEKGIANGYAAGVMNAVQRVKAEAGSASATEVSPVLQQKEPASECQAQSWDVWGMEECSRRQRGAAPAQSNPAPKDQEYP